MDHTVGLLVFRGVVKGLEFIIIYSKGTSRYYSFVDIISDTIIDVVKAYRTYSILMSYTCHQHSTVVGLMLS